MQRKLYKPVAARRLPPLILDKTEVVDHDADLIFDPFEERQGHEQDKACGMESSQDSNVTFLMPHKEVDYDSDWKMFRDEDFGLLEQYL